VIRLATKRDLKYCIKFAPDFWEEIKGKEWLGTLDIHFFSNYLTSGVNDGTIIGWVYEEEQSQKIYGAIFFLFKIDCFTRSPVLQELCWFMHKSRRNTMHAIRLLKTAEKYCKENGQKSIIMGNMQYPDFAKMDRFYKKLGYVNCDYSYLKHIKK